MAADVTNNAQVNQYMNTYDYSFVANEGVSMDNNDIGNVKNIQVVGDDMIVETTKGTLTINDVPELVVPQVNKEGVDNLSALLQDDNFMQDFAEVIKLFFEVNQEQRQANREIRNAERDMMVSSGEAAADKMRSAAALQLAGALIQSGMQVVGGAISMGGAAGAMKGMNNNSMTSDYATQFGTKWSSMGKIMEGMGGIGAAGFTYASTVESSKQKELETESGLHSSQAQDASDEFRNDHDMIQQAIQMLQQLQQSEKEVNATIITTI